MSDTKELIIAALDDYFNYLKEHSPRTKKEEKSIRVDDLKLSEVISLMEKDGIPAEATFTSIGDWLDGNHSPYLSWEVEVPATEEDRLEYLKSRFNGKGLIRSAWASVRDTLKANGYEHKPYRPDYSEEFGKTTVYDMYMNKEFDRLVKYYSQQFRKIDRTIKESND
jgi:hypothetical protein